MNYLHIYSYQKENTFSYKTSDLSSPHCFENLDGRSAHWNRQHNLIEEGQKVWTVLTTLCKAFQSKIKKKDIRDTSEQK